MSQKQAPAVRTLPLHTAVAQALSDVGVDTIFGIVGEANLFIVEDFVTLYGGEYVNSVREDGAVLMADGFARTTGRLGVASVTTGPGLTNTITALTEAVKARTPILLIVGDVPRGSGPILPQIDQAAVVAPTKAKFINIQSPGSVLREIRRAARTALTESHPVVINIPMDLLTEEVVWEAPQLAMHELQATRPDPIALDVALGIVANARRPLILAGRGAASSEAREALIGLSRAIGAPVATTIGAKGLFTGYDWNLGLHGTLATPVASEAIAAADAVIAFGAGLNNFTTAGWSLLAGKPVVQVDIDPERIGVLRDIDAGIVADAAATAEAMTAALTQVDHTPSTFASPELRDQIAGHSRWSEFKDYSDGESVDPRAAIVRLNELLPEDRIIVTDAGHFMISPLRYLDVSRSGSFAMASNFGSIGLGIGTAIGAAWGDRSRPTILVAGDGGFMMSLSEFTTAVRYGLDLTVVVVNDGGYGAEYHNLVIANKAPELSLIAWPDLAHVAESLGGSGVTVRSLGDLDEAMARFAQRDRPLLIDLRVDPRLHMQTCLA